MSEDLKWTNIQIDSQLLTSFMTCPRFHEYKHQRHLIPITGVPTSYQKGTLAHKGLQAYYEAYKANENQKDCIAHSLSSARMLAPTLDLDAESCLLVYRTLEEYFEYRKGDIFEVVDTERLFKIIVYENYPKRIILTGRIDMIIKEFQSKQLVPWDHKSESESWYHSNLSNQFKIYAIATGSLRLTVNRFGFQKSLPTEKKFKREDLAFVKETLEEFKNEELPWWTDRMLIAMEDNYFPPNFASCIKGHYGCEFSDKSNQPICPYPKQMREERLLRYFKEIEEWDPANIEK